MKIGENIYRYRSACGMSQSELADRLDVSRQSVSKWETDASVPELDKLIKMCEVFGITLDDLVRENNDSDESAESSTPRPQPAASDTAPVAPPYRTAGIILLCTAAAVAILLYLCGGPVAVLFALPFFICGLICMFMRRYVGLTCSWALYALVSLYFSHATGIASFPSVIYMLIVGIRDGIGRALFITIPLTLSELALVTWTVWAFRRRALPITKKTVIVSAVLLLWIAISAFIPQIIFPMENGITYGDLARALSFTANFIGATQTAAAVWLLVRYIPLIIRKK